MYATTIKPLLTLEEWREHVQFNPYALAQIGEGFGSQWRHGCSDVTYQFAWQSEDMLSREEILQAIADAEDMFAHEMGFYPAPRYFEGERVNYPLLKQVDMFNSMYTYDGHRKPVRTQWKYIQQVGVQYLEAISAGAAVVYSDSDGDGINDLLTITATVAAGTDPSTVCAFMVAADRLNKPQDFYEIRPLEVSISGTTATLTAPSWVGVKLAKYMGVNPQSLDVTDAGNFITTADVYYRKVDLSQAGSLVWENRWGYCDDPPCSSAIQGACFGIHDATMGYITPQPATWDADADEWALACLARGETPDRVVVNYVAGYPREDSGKMFAPFARAITALSVTLLAKRKCGCSRTNQILDYWQNFPGEGEVSKENRRVIATFEKLNSTWGAKQGAIEAWNTCKNYQLWDAV